MSYYIATTVDHPFETAIEKVTEALSAEGFGVLTENESLAPVATDVRDRLQRVVDSLR